MSRSDDFTHFHEQMNEKILAEGNLATRRFFHWMAGSIKTAGGSTGVPWSRWGW